MFMFGTLMTIIIVGYIGYYGYNFIHDLYFDKSGEVIASATVEETEVDIKDELGGFTQFDADEDYKTENQKTSAEQDTTGASTYGQGIPKDFFQEKEEYTTMTGGIEADQLQAMVSSLENKEDGSDFDIVVKAMSRTSV